MSHWNGPCVRLCFAFARDNQNQPLSVCMGAQQKPCQGWMRLIDCHSMEVNLTFGPEFATLHLCE
jgi:hypothetical protein